MRQMASQLAGVSKETLNKRAAEKREVAKELLLKGMSAVATHKVLRERFGQSLSNETILACRRALQENGQLPRGNDRKTVVSVPSRKAAGKKPVAKLSTR